MHIILAVNPVGFMLDTILSFSLVRVFLLSEGTKYYFNSTYTAEEEV